MDDLKHNLINLIFHPRKSNNKKDDNDHLIPVNDDIEIGVRFFISNKNYHNILFFHGNGEIAEDYNDIAKYFNDYNMNLIVAEYRGYGLSNGTPNKTNLLNDSLIIFDFVNNYLSENNFKNQLIVMGRSLGSASAAHIISNRDVKACIIESGFATEYSFLHLMNIDPDKINFQLEDGFENLKKIKKYTKPLYLIHADLDDIIPLSQAEMMLYDSSSKNKDLFVVNGANHNNIIMIAREEYFINIKSFIDSL